MTNQKPIQILVILLIILLAQSALVSGRPITDNVFEAAVKGAIIGAILGLIISLIIIILKYFNKRYKSKI